MRLEPPGQGIRPSRQSLRRGYATQAVHRPAVSRLTAHGVGVRSPIRWRRLSDGQFVRGPSRLFSALLGSSRLFSALLGSDPIESPTSGRPGVFEPLSVTIAAALTVETFFPQLITDPSRAGLVVAFITMVALP